MDEQRLRDLLMSVRDGATDVDGALQRLRRLPFEQLDHTTLDHHRQLRQGFPEVIFCQHKTPGQVAEIAGRLSAQGDIVFGTRATTAHFEAALSVVPDLQWNEIAGAFWVDRTQREPVPGIVVISAGTSDQRVAEEARLTATLMGNRVACISDVGVAGLHRLLHHVPLLQEARVLVVVAGMEGALPSVVAGLTGAPVIAVPTSVGYGASFGGLAALLTMLNSCASGISVVNIDNGFGAGFFAGLVNRRAAT